MDHAIRCLEYEISRKLDELDAMTRELRQLRAIAARQLSQELADDRGDDGIPPAAVPTPSPAPAADVVAVPTTGAGDLTPENVDETPAHGIVRPAVGEADQADDEFACDLCDRTFVKEHGLRMHRIKSHPIDKVSFDPDAARARAAAAA